MSNKNVTNGVRVVDFTSISDMSAARKELYDDVCRGMKVACEQLKELAHIDDPQAHRDFIGVLLSVRGNCESACQNLASVMSRTAIAEHLAKGGTLPTNPIDALALTRRLFPSGPLAPVEQPGVSRYEHSDGAPASDSRAN